METVVLLHGIWMKSLVMRPLATRLREAGFRTRCFTYPSINRSPAENARLLREFVKNEQAPLHFVAHSLGGIVLMHYFDQFNETREGRVVMLGSPVNGSENARVFNDIPILQRALGRSIDQGLLGNIPRWKGGCDLGVIAGTKGIGVGKLISRSDRANDGTVYVEETRINECRDFLTMPVSHTTMLFSAKVAKQVAGFLRHGYFNAEICSEK